MAELDQTSTPQFKRCGKCGEIKLITEFDRRKDSKDGYRGYCSKCLYKIKSNRIGELERRKKHQKKFRESKHGREYYYEYDKRYRQTGNGKIKIKEHKDRYRQSEKGKITEKLWRQNYHYIPSPIAIMHRYEYSMRPLVRERNIEKLKKWRLKNPNYSKERYHNLQEHYNWHGDVDEWYPILRQMEALETAPIVEVKI